MKKQGISLIVLVITIIVLAILAAAVIISINNTGLINSSQQTVLEEAYGNLTDLISMKYADLKIAANITTGSATPAGIVDAAKAGAAYHEAFTTAGFTGEALSAVGKTTYTKTNGSHTMTVEFTLSTDGVYSLTKTIATAEAK